MGRTIDADALNSIKFHSLPYHITPSDADAESYKRGWNDAIDSIIENAPTIKPERKKGKWKYIGFMVVECSECNTQFHGLECANFCPNCGADMREDQDGKGKKSN